MIIVTGHFISVLDTKHNCFVQGTTFKLAMPSLRLRCYCILGILLCQHGCTPAILLWTCVAFLQ